MAAPTPSIPHLLVAEADVALRWFSQQALVEMGYACTPASSLKETLRLLHQQPFDLVVTETFSRSGQGALEALRPLLALSHPLPVLLCTGWPLKEVEVQQAGFAALVLRPFRLEHLVVTEAEALHQPWSPAQRRQAEVVERYVASLARREVESMLALCTEEVQLYPWIVPAYPFARPVQGKAAARAYLQEQLAYFGDLQIDVVRLSPCPHGIAARSRLRWRDPAGVPRQQMVTVCVKMTPEGQVSQVGLPLPDERLAAHLNPLRGG